MTRLGAIPTRRLKYCEEEHGTWARQKRRDAPLPGFIPPRSASIVRFNVAPGNARHDRGFRVTLPLPNLQRSIDHDSTKTRSYRHDTLQFPCFLVCTVSERSRSDCAVDLQRRRGHARVESVLFCRVGDYRHMKVKPVLEFILRSRCIAPKFVNLGNLAARVWGR